MKRFLCASFVFTLAVFIAIGTSTSDADGGDEKLWGLWFMTTYLGDPADEETAVLQSSLTVNRERTWFMDGTAFTGQHPFFPNESEMEHGVWRRKNWTTFIMKGFWFSEMPVAPNTSLSLGRSICEVSFEDPDTVAGLCSFDFVPCPDSPFLFGEPRCPDPTAGDFLELGEEGATTVRVVMTRFRR